MTSQESLLKEWLNILFEKNELIHIRILDSPDHQYIQNEFLNYSFEKVKKFIDNYKYNLFISPHPRNSVEKADSEGVEKARIWYIDIDPKDGFLDPITNKEKIIEILNTNNLPPFAVINSGHGLHIYFKKEKWFEKWEWEDIEKIIKEKAQRVLKNFFVDPQYGSLGQVVRLPMSYNKKKKDGKWMDEKQVQIIYLNIDSILPEKLKPKTKIKNPTINNLLSKQALNLIPFWQKGYRQKLSLYLAGYYRKIGWSLKRTRELIKQICIKNNDEEIQKRIQAVEDTYKQDISSVKGFSGIRDILYEIFQDKSQVELMLKHFKIDLTTSELTEEETEVRSRIEHYLLESRFPDVHNATEVLVNYLEKRTRFYSLRDEDKTEIWTYNQQEGIYEPIGKSIIKETTRRILGVMYNSNLVKRVIDKIEADTYIDPSVFFEESREEIAVKNGILNLRTLELTPFTPEKKIFTKLPITYDPNKDCPNIKNFIKSTLKHEEDVNVMFEIFGYLLWKEYFIEKAFMFIGDGRNGKSKTLELMKIFLGPKNVVDIPLHDFETDPYAIGELHKKLANLSGDLDAKALNHTGTFKKLVGRDIISASRKFKTRITFVNYAKLIFATNQLPITYDLSPAFFKRWILFEFPYTFVEKGEYESIKDKKDIKLSNPNIIEEIVNDDELSGLLNEAIKGLHNLLSNKQFSISKNTEEIKNMWIRKANSLTAFIMDHIAFNWDSHISKKEFRKYYYTYCKKHKVKQMNDKIIKQTLSEYGIIEDRISIEGTLSRVWTGISFKDSISILDSFLFESSENNNSSKNNSRVARDAKDTTIVKIDWKNSQRVYIRGKHPGNLADPGNNLSEGNDGNISNDMGQKSNISNISNNTYSTGNEGSESVINAMSFIKSQLQISQNLHGKGMTLSELKQKLIETPEIQASDGDIDIAITQLLKRGDIYEPRVGYYEIRY